MSDDTEFDVAQPVDFEAVVLDLVRHRIPLKEIARRLGRSFSTVYGWHQGGVPRHPDGEALLSLWCSVTSFDRDSAPRVRQTRARPRTHIS